MNANKWNAEAPGIVTAGSIAAMAILASHWAHATGTRCIANQLQGRFSLVDPDSRLPKMAAWSDMDVSWYSNQLQDFIFNKKLGADGFSPLPHEFTFYGRKLRAGFNPQSFPGAPQYFGVRNVDTGESAQWFRAGYEEPEVEVRVWFNGKDRFLVHAKLPLESRKKIPDGQPLPIEDRYFDITFKLERMPDIPVEAAIER